MHTECIQTKASSSVSHIFNQHQATTASEWKLSFITKIFLRSLFSFSLSLSLSFFFLKSKFFFLAGDQSLLHPSNAGNLREGTEEVLRCCCLGESHFHCFKGSKLSMTRGKLIETFLEQLVHFVKDIFDHHHYNYVTGKFRKTTLGQKFSVYAHFRWSFQLFYPCWAKGKKKPSWKNFSSLLCHSYYWKLCWKWISAIHATN